MPFPELEALDNFAADSPESPLSKGGKWALLSLGVTTGQIATGAGKTWWEAKTEPELSDGAYWTPTQYAYPTVAAEVRSVGLGLSGGYISVWGCVSSPGEARINGYRVRWTHPPESSNWVRLLIDKFTEGTHEQIARGPEMRETATKDSFALHVEPGTVSAWYKAGPTIKEGPWQELVSVADSSYTTGYVAIGIKERGANYSVYKVSAATAVVRPGILRVEASVPAPAVATAPSIEGLVETPGRAVQASIPSATKVDTRVVESAVNTKADDAKVGTPIIEADVGTYE